MNSTVEKKEKIDVQGIVSQCLSNGLFRVKLENGLFIVATLSGNIRRNYIKILLGDQVTVELSAYDLSRGRIIFRHREKGPSQQQVLSSVQ